MNNILSGILITSTVLTGINYVMYQMICQIVPLRYWFNVVSIRKWIEQYDYDDGSFTQLLIVMSGSKSKSILNNTISNVISMIHSAVWLIIDEPSRYDNAFRSMSQGCSNADIWHIIDNKYKRKDGEYVTDTPQTISVTNHMTRRVDMLYVHMKNSYRRLRYLTSFIFTYLLWIPLLIIFNQSSVADAIFMTSIAGLLTGYISTLNKDCII